MKRKRRIALLVLLTLCLGLLSGCGARDRDLEDKEKWSNAQFVTKVAGAITADRENASLYYGGDNYRCSLAAGVQMQPYFALLDFKAEADENDPDLVHYRCRVPGVVGTAFNMTFERCFRRNAKYCAWVPMEGTVRIVRDESGHRRIDISQGDNAFAVYAALKYPESMVYLLYGLSIEDGISDANRGDALNAILNFTNDTYAAALGVEPFDYADSTVIPELREYEEHFEKIVNSASEYGYGFGNLMRQLSSTPYGWVGLGLALVIVLAVAAALISSAVEAIVQYLPQREVKKVSLVKCSRKNLSEKRRERLSDKVIQQGSHDLRSIITLSQLRSGDTAIMRELCENIHAGWNQEQSSQRAITLAGWSAAALGRIIAGKLKPEEIQSNLNSIGRAIDRYNQQVNQYREAIQELAEFEADNAATLAQIRERSGLLGSVRLDGYQAAVYRSRQEKKEDLDRLNEKLSRGLGNFMLDDGNLPLAYLVQILRDSANSIPRFLKQGVVMGLVDWLSETRTQPDAGKLLELVVSTRAQMIGSDNEMSFFEVRVPEDCTREEYSVILSDVLHCSNPSLPYCDTAKLLKTAEKEIPGCMEMLTACPLRLIDPANKRTLGFYQFQPFVHNMWVRYEPPIRVGRVIDRYHEVDDRTKPLSSGLNLSLFLDPYAVIPTFFHEFQHYKGDPNEASVFLKTQVFSIAFYRKYRKANAKADGVFAQLTMLLGMPPASDKVDKLNGIIRRFYGEQLSRQRAEAHAEETVEGINRMVDDFNEKETWCPEIRLPRLDEEGDSINSYLIREIVIRYGMVPKSVTKAEFEAILADQS